LVITKTKETASYKMEGASIPEWLPGAESPKCPVLNGDLNKKSNIIIIMPTKSHSPW
jgi:hypothetical protein